jgi:hypothetical protein
LVGDAETDMIVIVEAGDLAKMELTEANDVLV